MPYKVSIQRQTVSGEVVTVETELNSLAEWHSRIPQAYDLLDARMIKLNRLVYQESLKLGNLTDKEYNTLLNVELGLHGVQLPPREHESPLADLVKQAPPEQDAL